MKEFSEGIKNSPKSNETNPAAPAGLKKVSFQNMKIGGYPAIRAEYQIPFPFNPSTMVKTTTVIFDTEKSEITFGYSSASSSNYKKYLPQFDKVIRSIKFGQVLVILLMVVSIRIYYNQNPILLNQLIM